MLKFLIEKKNDEPKKDAKFLLQKVKDNYYLKKSLSVGRNGKKSHSALVKTTKICDTTKSKRGVTQFLTDILSRIGYISSTFTLLNIY